MNNFIIFYSVLIFLYLDLGTLRISKYYSCLYFSIYSMFMYKFNLSLYYNEVVFAYVIWDSFKHIYFNYHGTQYWQYIVHHVSLGLLILLRAPCGDLMRLIQMSEISSVFLNMSYILDKTKFEHKLSLIIFYVLFMYLRVYKIFFALVGTAYQNYTQGTLPFFMLENLSCELNGIDMLLLLPIIVLHGLWVVEIHKKYKYKLFVNKNACLNNNLLV